MRDRERDRTPCASSTSSTIPPSSITRATRRSAGSATPGRTTSRITATGSPSARIVRVIVARGRVGREPEHLGRPALSGSRRSEVAHAQPDAAPLGELGVGPQDLEALVERGRAHRLADVGAAALPARDLARLLEPVERGPQRAARDAEHRGQLELGRQPVAGPVRAGRQPRAQRLLGVVDQ